ncbi:MAG: hypothetical protein J5685_11135, partial [Clostridiales bacterium]|nr:hypothetical protein [Clostridiales bacterium]
DDNEVYHIKSFCDNDNIFDSNFNRIPGVGFCLDSTKGSPQTTAFYRRSVLSEYTRFTDDEKILLMSIASNPQGVVEFLDQLAQTRNCVQMFIDENRGAYSHDYYDVQMIMWAITFRASNTTGSEYYETSGFARRAEKYGVASDDPLNDPNSLWNQLYVPVFEYLRNTCPSVPGHDAYVYIPENSYYQPILGAVFETDEQVVEITKTVVDGNGDPVTFNGTDDNGFTVEVSIFNTLDQRIVEGEPFTVVRSDNSSETYTTDDQGTFSFVLHANETVSLHGFPTHYFQVTIGEDVANFGDNCYFVRSDATNIVSTSEQFTVMNLDADTDDRINIINCYDVPVTSTTESSQTSESSESSESTAPSESTEPSVTESSVPSETTPSETAASESSSDTSATVSSSDTSVTDSSSDTSATGSSVPVATDTSATDSSFQDRVLSEARHSDNAVTDSAVDAAVVTTATVNSAPSTAASNATVTRDVVAATGEGISGTRIAAFAVIALSVVSLSGMIFLTRKKREQ